MHGRACLLQSVGSDADDQIRAKDVQSFWEKKQVAVCTETAENTSNLGNSAGKNYVQLREIQAELPEPKEEEEEEEMDGTESHLDLDTSRAAEDSAIRVCPLCYEIVSVRGRAAHAARLLAAEAANRAEIRMTGSSNGDSPEHPRPAGRLIPLGGAGLLTFPCGVGGPASQAPGIAAAKSAPAAPCGSN